VNHKLVYRLYRDEGLSSRRRRKRRHRSAVRRKPCRPATRPNEVWTLDFVHDALFDGQAFRVLTAVDEYTRECLLLEAAQSFRGETVAQRLRRAIHERGTRPRRIRVDNGTEFTSKAMDRWDPDRGSGAPERGSLSRFQWSEISEAGHVRHDKGHLSCALK